MGAAISERIVKASKARLAPCPPDPGRRKRRERREVVEARGGLRIGVLALVYRRRRGSSGRGRAANGGPRSDRPIEPRLGGLTKNGSTYCL